MYVKYSIYNKLVQVMRSYLLLVQSLYGLERCHFIAVLVCLHTVLLGVYQSVLYCTVVWIRFILTAQRRHRLLHKLQG